MKNQKNKRKIIISICLVLSLALFLTFSFKSNEWNIKKYVFSSFLSNNDDDYVKIIDVGQGDSILIYSNGYSALIDTGTSEYSDNVCSELSDAGIKAIDVVLITHFHQDHYGGLDKISEKYKIHNLIIPDTSYTKEDTSEILNTKSSIISNGGNIYTGTQGMHFTIGEFSLTILGYYKNQNNENNKSIITMAEISHRRFLFMGDGEKETESLLRDDGLDLKCDVLKVGHHGSNTSTTTDFIKATRPDFAVVSVGKNNQYSLPSSDIIQNLQNFKITVLRTDILGDILFKIENGEIMYKK